MKLLFEYGEWEKVSNREALTAMLQNMWGERDKPSETEVLSDEEKTKRYQPFFKFDGNEIRANNFVGFIQNGSELIEIYPKVFRNSKDAEAMKGLMLQHIFFWFSYCRKWRFPFNKASLETKDIQEFPELIINLIANQIFDMVSTYPLSRYQHVEQALQTPRGSINFNRYINNSMSKGNYQNIDCDFEPFLIDNKVNRIIKHCTRLLLDQTRFFENQRILHEVIFILDEVEDVAFVINDVEGITFNLFFEGYDSVMDSCRLVLSQQLYTANIYDLSQWCLLFPMEYIFEDFVAGFIEEKFGKEWKVEYQKSEKYLAHDSQKNNVFRMEHDIYLTHKDSDLRVIVDTKYKLRDSNFKADKKRGIDQGDLYQMTSYAFRRGCKSVLLIYPNIESEVVNTRDTFRIKSGFNAVDIIDVTAIEIPFWSIGDFNSLSQRLEELISIELNVVLKTYKSSKEENSISGQT